MKSLRTGQLRTRLRGVAAKQGVRRNALDPLNARLRMNSTLNADKGSVVYCRDRGKALIGLRLGSVIFDLYRENGDLANFGE
jgi:hypothetical protein